MDLAGWLLQTGGQLVGEKLARWATADRAKEFLSAVVPRGLAELLAANVGEGLAADSLWAGLAQAPVEQLVPGLDPRAKRALEDAWQAFVRELRTKARERGAQAQTPPSPAPTDLQGVVGSTFLPILTDPARQQQCVAALDESAAHFEERAARLRAARRKVSGK